MSELDLNNIEQMMSTIMGLEHVIPDCLIIPAVHERLVGRILFYKPPILKRQGARARKLALNWRKA